MSGDGWSSSWELESGWSCTGGSSTTKDICSEIWGDCGRFNSLSTYWDDGNTINGDGWSSICSIETGWNWSGGTTTTIKYIHYWILSSFEFLSNIIYLISNIDFISKIYYSFLNK